MKPNPITQELIQSQKIIELKRLHKKLFIKFAKTKLLHQGRITLNQYLRLIKLYNLQLEQWEDEFEQIFALPLIKFLHNLLNA